MYQQGLTYDDILIRPTYSTIESRSECDVSTYLTENIKLNVPIIAANMDTVCESSMAIRMALLGGVGIIHRYMTVEQQAAQIKTVKKYTSKFRTDFFSLAVDSTYQDYLQLMRTTGIKTFPVISGDNTLEGIITRRDFWGVEDSSAEIKDHMTPFDKLHFIIEDQFDDDFVMNLMSEHKVEQLPVVSKEDIHIIVGLVSRKDLNHIKLKYPDKVTDSENKLLVGAAVGVKLNPDSLIPLINAKPDFLCIDIAHGYHQLTDRTLADLKVAFPDMPVIVGNVATLDAVNHYKDKADGIKVNIGPGCFAAGTRVLMANGTYKNIEAIAVGDYVINKDGNPVKVIDAFCTGTRKVSKIRNSNWYEVTYVTPDHQFFVGDLSTNSHVNFLDKPNKAGQSKFKWLPIEDRRMKKLLTPKHIKFNMPETFKLELEGIALTPSYELGFMFGVVLANTSKDAQIISLNPTMRQHRDRFISAFESVFPSNSPIVKNDAVEIQVKSDFKPFIAMLRMFGDKGNKHLPEEYLVNHPEYLKGLYEGLCLRDEVRDKHTFVSSETKLVELFNVLCYLLKGHFPDNQKTSYYGITHFNCIVDNKAKFTKDYQLVNLMGYTETDSEIPVYDITVDCPTHSFIADNVIVHNSACRTRVVTGCGVPEFTCIRECSSGGYPYLISDGGITNSGDIVKALFGGAATVMIGSLLAGTSDSPGKVIEMDGKKVKRFRGMASHEAYYEKNLSLGESVEAFHFEAEGASGYVDYKGETDSFILRLVQGIKSGMSYCGARNLDELHVYGANEQNFYTVSSMGFSRNGAHHMKTK